MNPFVFDQLMNADPMLFLLCIGGLFAAIILYFAFDIIRLISYFMREVIRDFYTNWKSKRPPK